MRSTDNSRGCTYRTPTTAPSSTPSAERQPWAETSLPVFSFASRYKNTSDLRNSQSKKQGAILAQTSATNDRAEGEPEKKRGEGDLEVGCPKWKKESRRSRSSDLLSAAGAPENQRKNSGARQSQLRQRGFCATERPPGRDDGSWSLSLIGHLAVPRTKLLGGGPSCHASSHAISTCSTEYPASICLFTIPDIVAVEQLEPFGAV